MKQKISTIEETFQHLTNAIAETMEHTECPPSVYNDLLDLTTDWQARFPVDATKQVRILTPIALANAGS